MATLSTYRTWFITTALLVLFFGVRLWQIDSLPLFIDETLSIQRAEETLAGNPLFFATQGKVLLPWLLTPAVVVDNAIYFMARYATLLMVLLGAASAIALARRIADWPIAWIALLALLFNPMLHFHDRLILADTLLHVALTIAAWLLWRTFDAAHVTLRRAVFAGVAFAAVILAKASGIVMLPLPFVFAVLLSRWTWPKRLQALTVVYGTIVALWLPFYVLLRSRGIDFFGRAAQGTSSSLLDLERFWLNTQFVAEGFTAYLGLLPLLALAVTIVLALVFKPRPALALLAWAGGFIVALILVGDEIYHRYWLGNWPALALLLALGVWGGLQMRWLRWGSLLILLIWVVPAALFIQRAATNPATLDLPHADRVQYLEADSAGTTLRELASFLENGAEPVIGAFVGCDSLSYYLSSHVELTCVPFGGSAQEREARLAAVLQTEGWIILETPGYFEAEMLNARLETLTIFERPGDLMTVRVYSYAQLQS